MATLSNYISLSTNIPNAMNAAANATTKAYQSMNTLHNKMTGVSNASETLKASMGGIMNSFAGNLLASTVMNGIGAIKGAIESIQDTATEWAQVQARLKLVAGSQENAIYLNKQIFESAQRARGGYLEMADAVIQVSQSAHDAFPDPRKAVEFMEGIQKVLKLKKEDREMKVIIFPNTQRYRCKNYTNMIKREDVYKIGLFNKPHGIHGELSFTFTDDIFDRADCDYLICRLDDIFVPFFIEEYRFRSDSTALVKLEGVDTAERARMFTNVEVYFPVKHAEEAGPGELSWDFFVGFRVEDVRHGALGKVTDVDTSTVNTLFVVDRDGDELLIPAQEELIAGIDQKHKIITVDLPEGLLSLDECDDEES